MAKMLRLFIHANNRYMRVSAMQSGIINIKEDWSFVEIIIVIATNYVTQ